MDAPTRRRRRMTSALAVGTSSEMTALAQPNHSGVLNGELSRVQVLTWVNEAAPANPATTSRISTRTAFSARSPRDIGDTVRLQAQVRGKGGSAVSGCRV